MIDVPCFVPSIELPRFAKSFLQISTKSLRHTPYDSFGSKKRAHYRCFIFKQQFLLAAGDVRNNSLPLEYSSCCSVFKFFSKALDAFDTFVAGNYPILGDRQEMS